MSNSSIQAFITFLRGEAQQAEERSRRLRSAATAIEAQHREAIRNKKRSHDTATKSASTNDDRSGYSLFVQENFELMKKDHSEISTLEISSILDRQWASTSEEEKQIWNYRSAQRLNQSVVTLPGLPDFEQAPPDDGSEDDESGARKEQDSRRDCITESVSV